MLARRRYGRWIALDRVHAAVYSIALLARAAGPACVALASQMIYLRLTESAPPARVSPPGLAPLGSPRREAKPDLPSFLLKEF